MNRSQVSLWANMYVPEGSMAFFWSWAYDMAQNAAMAIAVKTILFTSFILTVDFRFPYYDVYDALWRDGSGLRLLLFRCVVLEVSGY